MIKSHLKNSLLFLLVLLLAVPQSAVLACDFGGTTVPGAAPDGGGGEGCGGEACQQDSEVPLDCPSCKMFNDIARGGGEIYYYDGSEFTRDIDFRLDGVMPIIIERSYNNQSTLDTPLGYGWDHSYNEHLYTYADGSAIIRRDTGFKERFILTGGAYVSEKNSRTGTLIQEGDGTFIYTDMRGTKRLFDRDGRLVSITDPHGNSLRMQWSSSKMGLSGVSPYSVNPAATMMVANGYQLLRIEQWDAGDTFTGRFVQFTYDPPSGRLTSVSDSSGRTVSYSHDASGNLSRVDFPVGLYTTFSYTDSDDIHNLTEIARGYGANSAVTQLTRTYDSSDRVTNEYYAEGRLYISYTIPLQKTKVTKYIRNDSGSTLATQETVYEFDGQGQLSKKTDEEKRIEYTYDDRGNVSQEVVYQNTNGNESYPDLLQYRTITREYDDDNNMTRQQVYLPESGEVLTETFSYEQGWLLSHQNASSLSPGVIHRTERELVSTGSRPVNVAAEKTLISGDANGTYTSISFGYDSNGQRNSIGYENGDTIESEYTNGQLTSKDGFLFTWDQRGNLTSITDRNGNQTSMEYDLNNRLTKVTNELTESTVYTYTGWDLTSVEHGKTAQHSGRFTNFAYDTLGRVTGSSADLDGQPVMQKSYTYDSEDNILTTTDQLSRVVQFAYDRFNRLVSVTDPDSKVSTFSYNFLGGRSSTTDPLNNTSTFSYDELGRLVSTTDALGGETSMQYNALGLVTGVTDAESRQFSYGYDQAGRLIWQEMPPTGRESYSLDSRGRVIESTGSDGKRTLFEYDSDSRVRKITLAAGEPESSSLFYGYDFMGNLTWYTDTSISPSPLFRMGYDALNRLTSKTLEPINKTVSYDYAATGERSRIGLDNGGSELFSYSYSRNSAGLLASMTEQPLNRTTTFSHDNSGALSGIGYANGVTSTLGYNTRGFLSDLNYSNSSSQPLVGFHYDYDDLGRITTITDSAGATGYGYDDLSRLTSAAYPVASGLQDETYTYDGTGNRLSSADIADWTYDQAGRLVHYGDTTLHYDKRGNQIQEINSAQITNFTYDTLGRMTGANRTGMQAEYDYGFASQRVRKTVDGATTWYLYEGANLLAEFDGQGNLLRSYGYQPESFNLVSITEGGVDYSVLNNHLQTPVMAANVAETPIWQSQYQAFGQALLDSDPDGNGADFILNQRFPGQVEDVETSLVYNWNRYYKNSSGRFLSSDLKGINDGVNTYSYTHNNPTHNIDPNGLISFSEFFPVYSEKVRKGVAYVFGEHAKSWGEIQRNFDQANTASERLGIVMNGFSDLSSLALELPVTAIAAISLGGTYGDIAGYSNSDEGRLALQTFVDYTEPCALAMGVATLKVSSMRKFYKLVDEKKTGKAIFEYFRGNAEFSLGVIEATTQYNDKYKDVHSVVNVSREIVGKL